MSSQDPLLIDDAEYLCGHSAFQEGLSGQLLLLPSWIGFTSADFEEPTEDGLPLSSVESIEISEGEESGIAWGSVAANLFNHVFSSNAGPTPHSMGGTFDYVNLAISTNDGQTACIRIHGVTMSRVRDAIAPTLKAAGIRLETA